MKPVDELISAYLNDEATEAEAETLFVWVRGKPENAVEFARACSLHAHLRERIHGERQLETERERFACQRPEGAQPWGRRVSGRTVWARRIGELNRFLVAAVLMMMLQMSWGAVTLLKLCQPVASSVTIETATQTENPS